MCWHTKCCHVGKLLKKEGRWMVWSCRMHVTLDMHTGLSGILNHNEQWTPHLGAYIYTSPQTQLHIQCCYGWINSLPHTLPHSQCGNTVNISAVVMLGFWLCQFNTGGLVCGLCLSSWAKFFLCSNLMYVLEDRVGDICGLSFIGCC